MAVTFVKIRVPGSYTMLSQRKHDRPGQTTVITVWVRETG